MTQTVETPKISPLKTALLLAVILAIVVAVGAAIWWMLMEPRLLSHALMQDVLLKGVALWALLFGMALMVWHIVQNGIRALVLGSVPLPAPPLENSDQPTHLADLITHLRDHYGLLWRRKVRVLLVIGEPDEIAAIAPKLAIYQWLEGQGTVLLWGGRAQEHLDRTFPEKWNGLSRWRSLDGVVWALSSAQTSDEDAMGTGVRQVQRLARSVGWQLPLHLWQVVASAWPQDKRATQPVGCLLPSPFDAQALQDRLTGLLEPLRHEGWAQMSDTFAHDFLLRLSHDLQHEGIARWHRTLAVLAREFARGVPLRGVWFSLPAPPTPHDFKHDWTVPSVWQGVLGDTARSHRLGWSVPRIGHALALGLAVFWGAGLLLSFANNRVLIDQVQASLTAMEQAGSGDEQLIAFHDLVLELARLDDRVRDGAPWYERFGLNRNEVLLGALWPRYVEANNRLIRDPAAATLRHQLDALVQLAPDSPERAERGRAAHDLLKAYLMMARPEKADASFLVNVLTEVEPARAGISEGLWKTLAPHLWQFYGEHLAANPDWRIEDDSRLVAQARRVLLGQMEQRNAEASLYRQILDDADRHYPDLGVQQLVGDTDALALFSSDASVPGVFTRQAWEGQVRQAINKIAEARSEEIDWVLSDKPAEIGPRLNPDHLREQLTERYFQDYAGAWLDLLNSLRWRKPGSLDEVIDQLTLMSDARHSPLIALLNSLAYHGQAGAGDQALTDSQVKSAQTLIGQFIGQDKTALIDPLVQLPGGPLDATFGPLLALVSTDPENRRGAEDMSLSSYLNQVTRVRLKLEQVRSAPDPLDLTLALAQTVFQGHSIDLTDTQTYAGLMAASLGSEWHTAAQTLFVKPLDNAWQQVLRPSAAGINRQWQRSIVSHWNDAFTSRYPFASTASDASLPMLGQMIRADSGRIEQFLQRQLNGVVRKEGNRWVADSRHSQGLRLNPQFLTAVNQLSDIADVLYTDGGMGLSFELQGKGVRDVVQTTFILNGTKHHYFNQKESWQRFTWPGSSEYPGVSLTWTSVHAGERLFGDYQGTWGLIRLLEKARATPLDDGDSRYRLVLKAPDGLNLTWYLRTELDAGPLALLKLRGFGLPQQIFLGEGAAQDSYAENGSFQ